MGMKYFIFKISMKVIGLFQYFVGPKLSLSHEGSAMISTPTEKGVMMIGGSSDIIELSGDSPEKLEWKIIEQKLQQPKYAHMLFYISNEIAATLTKNSSNHSEKN